VKEITILRTLVIILTIICIYTKIKLEEVEGMQKDIISTIKVITMNEERMLKMHQYHKASSEYLYTRMNSDDKNEMLISETKYAVRNCNHGY